MDKIWDVFYHLVQGSMITAELEPRFHILSRYSSARISNEFEWIWNLIKRLHGTYYLATTQMVVSRNYFQSIIKHEKMIEFIVYATYEGTKKVYYHGEFSRHAS